MNLHDYAVRERLYDHCGFCMFWSGSRAKFSEGKCNNIASCLYKQTTTKRGFCDKYTENYVENCEEE